jgi:hypothetical protein
MAPWVGLIRGVLTPLTLWAAFGRPILFKDKMVEPVASWPHAQNH